MRYIFLFVIAILAGCSWLNNSDDSARKDGAEIVATKDQNRATDKSLEACSGAFEATVSNLENGKSFKPLFDFYKNHSECMDGSYSQGIEGAISKALDQKWDNLKDLKSLFDADSGFKAYFFKNIGCYVSATESYLEAVTKRSKGSCSNELKQLCSELLIASEKALNYSKEQ